MDNLSVDTLQSALTGPFGTPLRYLSHVGSTNTEALEWAEAGAPEGALVVAEHQTAGRGRWGRTWFASPGAALTFSLVLRPRVTLERLSLLTTALGLAVAEGVEKVAAVPTTLKWPNDVNVDSRKVAGILVETKLTQSNVDAAVAGVGINVGRFGDDVPEDVMEQATSISDALARRGVDACPSRGEVLAAVLQSFEHLYPAIEDRRRSDDLIERAGARSDVLGRAVTVRLASGSSIAGIATGLLPTGALEVDARGVRTSVEAGEIEQLRPA